MNILKFKNTQKNCIRHLTILISTFLPLTCNFTHRIKNISFRRKSNRSYVAIKMFEKCIRFDENFVPAYLGLSKIQNGISSGVLLQKALQMNAESSIVRLEFADWLYAKCMNIQFWREKVTELEFLSFQIYTSKHWNIIQSELGMKARFSYLSLLALWKL